MSGGLNLAGGRARKVIHVITTLDVGGAEKHLLSLTGALDRERFHPVVVYLKGVGSMAADFKQEGVRVLSVPMRGPLDLSLLPRLRALFREEKPAIVHTHLFKADIYGAFAAHRAGVPVVLSTKHNEDQYLRNPFFAFLGRKAAAACDRVVVISEAVGRFTEQVGGIPAIKMRKIPYGLKFSPPENGARPRIRGELGVPEEAPLVGTVGRLYPQKGQVYLLRAMAEVVKEVEGVRLLIVGDGPLRGELEAEARQLGIASRVVFAGLRRDVPAILSAIDLFTLPSLWEGFGLVLLEAMAASKPVIGTRVGSLPEVISENETGLLVPPSDPGSLARAILELLSRPERARRMGRAGRGRLESLFSLETMVRAWENLYVELLQEKGLVG